MKSPILMFFLLIISTGFGAVGVTMPTVAPVSDDVLLSAIADVETGNNPAKRGHYGERTALQILPQTWRQYSRVPHSASATNPAETDRVARAYLATIRSRLKSRGLPETPFFIAAGWNAGPGWKRLTRGTISYAERVSNLVEASQPKDAAPAPTMAAVRTLEVADVLPKPQHTLASVDATVPVIRLSLQ